MPYITIDLFGNPRSEDDHDRPTEAWIAGWNACMYDGINSNPYTLGEQEHTDWAAGFAAAERD